MLDVNNLGVSYKNKIALNHTSFSFLDKTYVLIGANGAGKTTLFRCITQNIDTYSGSITYGEITSPFIGYLPQFFGPFYDLTVVETLRYLANYKKDTICRSDIDYILKIFELESIKNNRVKKLSGGNMLVWLANRASLPPTCFRVSNVHSHPPRQNNEDNL